MALQHIIGMMPKPAPSGGIYLEDNFDDGVVGSQWVNTGCTESSGRLNLIDSLSGVKTNFNFVGKYFQCQAPSAASGSWFVRFTAGANGFSLDYYPHASILRGRVNFAPGSSVAYDSSYTWVRVRNVGTDMLIDTSPDGVNWTHRTTDSVTGHDYSSCSIGLSWVAGDAVTIDNLTSDILS